jgi:hypothetical protein
VGGLSSPSARALVAIYGLIVLRRCSMAWTNANEGSGPFSETHDTYLWHWRYRSWGVFCRGAVGQGFCNAIAGGSSSSTLFAL